MFESFPDIVKMKQVPEMIPVSYQTVKKLVREGKIKSFKIGNRVMIPKRFIEEYVIAESYRK